MRRIQLFTHLLFGLAGLSAVCAQSISGPTTFYCTNSDASYSADIPASPGPGLRSVEWKVYGGTILLEETGSQTTSALVEWNAAAGGSGAVVLNVYTVTGGYSTDSLVVSFAYDQVAEPVINGAPEACQAEIAHYSVAQVANHEVSWEVAGGQIITSQNNQHEIDVLWGTGTQGQLKVTQTLYGTNYLAPHLGYGPLCEGIDIKSVILQPLIGNSPVCGAAQKQPNAGNAGAAVIGMKLYPNPASDQATILLENLQEHGAVNVLIYSPEGRVVRTTSIAHNGGSMLESVLSLNGLPNGVYWVQVDSDQGRIGQKLWLMR